MRRHFAASLAVAVLSSLAAAQTQPSTPGQTTQPGQVPAPTRTPPRVLRPGELPPRGTASIRGQVVAGDTGAPIRRAQVRAMSLEARGGGVTSTDAEGLFEIKDLPAGRYTITAMKGGYVSLQFGQRRPGEPGTPLELSEGQKADKVSFFLPRGGVIAGQITDDTGDGVPGISVSALRYMFAGGSRRLVPAAADGSTDRTDDQGSYRLYGLPPGEYFLSATNSRGNFAQPEVNNTEAEGYAPTYYPGTPSLAEAQRVVVKAGQLTPGTNFTLTIARLARIKGRAINSRGEPLARGMIMIAPADPASVMFFGNNTMAAGDGTFQIPNVAPGRYTLNIRPMGPPTSGDEFAALPITVGSEDLEDVLVTTSPGGTARGFVIAEDGSPPPFRGDLIQVFANALEPMMMTAGNNMGRVNGDYSFEISSVFDRRVIRASVPTTTGWYLKGVYLDGADITDTGVEFGPGKTVEGLQIVLTQKTTDLSGLVTDARGRTVLDATVIVFPANRDRWRFLSRHLRTARPDTEGRFRFRSLPPDDDYLIIAVQNLQEGQGGDPEFLARVRDQAKPFALGEGETKTLDLRLSTPQP